MSEIPPFSSPFSSFSNDIFGPFRNPSVSAQTLFDSRASTMPSKTNSVFNHWPWLASLSPRNVRRYLVTLLILASIAFLWTKRRTSVSVYALKERLLLHALPPLYEEWTNFETRLPSQDLSLPYPEGEHARFFFVDNHVWGLGFNNALQEQLLLAHLAYLSNRTFVFDTYAWYYGRDQPYSEYNGKIIPSRIPFTAIISGPNVGGSWPEGIRAPRAVSWPYYKSMCPHPTNVKSNDLEYRLGPVGNSDVGAIMEAWSMRLRSAASKCMEMRESDQLFNWYHFGSGSMLQPFLKDFLNSPILHGFGWSTLIDDAVKSNSHLITGRKTSVWESWMSGAEDPDLISANDKNAIPGLLAIHVRRGDFDEHCRERAKWGSSYMGWLMNPELPDHFDIPTENGYHQTDELTKQYMSHCWPTPEEIIAKISEVRGTEEGKTLDRVYIMTNGPIEWVSNLKNDILNMGGWQLVSTSRDLSLTHEQKYIAQAVDMAIAMRSQVFIGNGFSSLSANAILFRLSRHFSAMSNRLW